MSNPLMVFICAPYRAPDYLGTSRNIEQVKQKAIEIAACNIYPFSPHLNTAHFDHAVPLQFPDCYYTEDLYLGGCLRILKDCDALFLLGETITEGMRGELEFANAHGIPVLTSIKEIQEWKNDLVELGIEEEHS